LELANEEWFMGRMLEAMKLVNPRHRPSADGVSAPTPLWPRPQPAGTPAEPVSIAPSEEEAEGSESEKKDELPFIEVGGPRAAIDASPQVLAARASRAGKAPAAATGPRLRTVVLPTQADAPMRIMSVVFRPFAVEPCPAEPAARRFAPELIAYHRSEHPVSEQYRALAEGIAGQLPTGRPQVVLFTALTPEADATTVLLNTAITFARQGQLRVVAMDANLRRPALARRFGLPDAPGLRDVVAGSRTLAEALQETGQPNLSALTAGDGGQPRLLADALRPVLRQLRERFDLVLLDAPCWDGRPEIVALGSVCDLTYLVLPEAEADTPDTEAWLRTLPQQGAHLRGSIVTKR
jgi:Mrp family chromosome partitioning ATPase